MKRRQWLMLGSAAAAAGAGVAWRLRIEQRAPDLPSPRSAAGRSEGDTTHAGPAGSSHAGDSSDLWSLRFEKPGGGELAMTSLRGKPLLLNFWGSWCPPCIEEMPLLDQFARSHERAGWQVLGLAIDNPQGVRDFLARRPVSYLIGLAGFEGSDLARRLGNSQGALPYTVVLNRQGQQVQQKNGLVDAELLARWSQLG